MLSEKLLKCLICPVCGGAPLGLTVVEADGERIIEARLNCSDCKRWYPVRDDIPAMMPPDLGSNLSAADDRWEGWGAAMHRFLRWRESAWADPEAAAKRRESARAMHERFIDFCDLQDEPLDLLDIGCGTGHVADLLPETVSYVGIDPLAGGRSPSGEMPAEIPRPQRQVSVVQGVGELLPMADDSFDAALLMGVLDHARSTSEVLDEAARVLRPGGVLGVLVAFTRTDESGGLADVLRSLMRSLTAQQGPHAQDTHLHTFFSVDEVAELVAHRFEVRDVMEYSNRAFVRASAEGACV
ncbi:MAG: methyltransferase domain-containing protein [Armatimonadota bacterium]